LHIILFMKSHINLRKKYTEQTAILLSKEERKLLENLKEFFKGTASSIIRFAISRLANDFKIKAGGIQ